MSKMFDSSIKNDDGTYGAVRDMTEAEQAQYDSDMAFQPEEVSS